MIKLSQISNKCQIYYYSSSVVAHGALSIVYSVLWCTIRHSENAATLNHCRAGIISQSRPRRDAGGTGRIVLGYFPNDLNTFPYARISPRIVEEGDQLNNYISEGSTPSEQGTGKLELVGH